MRLTLVCELIMYFNVENNSLELTRIFQNIFIDPIVSARKKRRRREVDMKRERKKEKDDYVLFGSSPTKYFGSSSAYTPHDSLP